jgi:hypothetical protein
MFVYEVQEIANKLKDAIERFHKEVLTNKEAFTLDERWTAYEKVAELLPIGYDYCGNAFEEVLGDISLYDEFYIERYQTAKYVNQVEGLEDDLASAEEDVAYEPRYTRELVDAIKEAILASGMQGFIYDW